jgi:hypothetical protein
MASFIAQHLSGMRLAGSPAGSWIEPNLDDGATNRIDDQPRALPGKE